MHRPDALDSGWQNQQILKGGRLELTNGRMLHQLSTFWGESHKRDRLHNCSLGYALPPVAEPSGPTQGRRTLSRHGSSPAVQSGTSRTVTDLAGIGHRSFF